MLKLTTKRTKKFYLPQDASGETWIEIVHLKPGEVSDIEAKTNSIKSKQSEGEEFVTEIDLKLNDRTKAYVQASITDWSGFLDPSDKALKCTDRNKLSVLKEFDWFAEYVAKCREELAEEVEEDGEDAEKN